jgi:hypothetical protein
MRGLLVVGCCGAVLSAHPPQTDDLQRNLDLAAAYLERYEHDVTAITARETYVQSIPFEARMRTLRSYLVVIAEPREGWVEFRDVFEVDGSAVHDQHDRLMRLFMQPKPDTRDQARRIADESARFNLSPKEAPFQRTVNVPFTALRFLRRANHTRSAWHFGGRERVGTREAAVLRFEEQAKPRLIGSRQQIAARGAFWLDTSIGTVLRSELRLATDPIFTTIRVDYGEQPALRLWLPATMREEYRLRLPYGDRTHLESRADYSDFRQFRVDTSTTIK